ncbi:histone H2B-like [Spodoptera frugiperda]|uniref:Histone H2B-like n=1 Tax=Spodoptera frugiperda TaxID=7108 RepID=A0A9R0E5V6_SPOFR|nr:histone H2B-like [Spodoptera frugiperda]
MPPKTSGKAAKKTRSKAQKTIIKATTETNYAAYVAKVLKQFHPDIGISGKAMSIMNSFLNDSFERIAGEASRLTQYSKRSTITAKDIQTSVRFLLSGDLAKQAEREGVEALAKYTSSHLVDDTFSTTNELDGCSLRDIKEYIGAQYKVDAERLAPFLRNDLKGAVEEGTLIPTSRPSPFVKRKLRKK